MKQLFLITSTLLFSLGLYAQTPQGINYQAVARDNGGVLLANAAISVRTTITNGNSMSVLYQETHATTTNAYGLFNIVVGQGTPTNGTFASIPWATSEPWLQVELDPNGGTAFVLMGSQQLMSVPYALHAKTADSAPGDNWGTQTVQSNATLGGNGTTGNPLKLAQQGASNGQALKWNGSAWVPGDDANTTYTSGTGITIAGNTVSNTGDTNANDDVTNTTAAGGDLNGTYPSPTVDGLQGRPVAGTAPTTGQVLKYNGTQWAPGADNNTSFTQGTGINISGGTISNTVTGLNDLNDVNSTGASSGQVLKYNGTNWIPGTDNTAVSSGAVNTTPRISGDGTAGSPLDIAQQGASTGQLLGWNGTGWAPTSGAGGLWSSNGNHIYNSNTANVGIGTNAPNAKLDVMGSVALNDNTLLLRGGNDPNHGLGFNSTLNGPYLFGYDGGALGTAGQPNALEWSWTGDATAKNNLFVEKHLMVDHADANNGTLTNGLSFGSSLSEGVGSNRTTSVNQFGLDFYTNTTPRLSITNAGKVGIGTTSPSSDLHVHRSDLIGSSIKLTHMNTGITTADGADVAEEGTDLWLRNWENGAVKFSTNGQQRMVLDNGGNLGIGTQTPNAKLDVQGSALFSGNVGIGTADPQAAFDVTGTVRIADGTQGEGKVLTSDADGTAHWSMPPSNEVAFKAIRRYAAGDIAFEACTVDSLVFDSVFVNTGNAYDKTRGVFTAPSAGLYYFNVSVLFFSTQRPHVYSAILMTDDVWQRVESVFEQSTTMAGGTILPVSGHLYLQAGDRVWIRCCEYSDGNATIRGFVADSQFSGCKVR